MPDKMTFSMVLKKEGKHVAHYYDGADPEDDDPFKNEAFKDAYMPHASFEALGKPEIISVTIEVPATKTKRRRSAKSQAA